MRNRVWLTVAVLIGSIVAGSVIDILLLRGALWREKEHSTQQVVQSGFSVLRHFHDLQEKGVLSQAAAQAAAIDTVKSMRYDEKEYFWLNDLGTPFPKMIMHPTMPELNGQLLDTALFSGATGQRVGTDGVFTPADGKRNIAVVIVEVVNQGGEGYVTYNWPKAAKAGGSTGQLYPKLSYVKKFEPWGWVIGSGVYVDDVDAAVRKQAGRNLLLVVGTGLVLLFFSSLMARSITQPLQRLVSAMRALGRGDAGWAQRLQVEGSSEIAELAGGFNEMQGQLEARDAELARHRQSLEAQVTQRTGELRDSNLQLENELAERQQTERDLQHSRARIRALLDASDESVLLLDSQGRILAINVFAARRFGQTPKALVNQNFFDLIPPELAASRRAAVRQVASTGEPIHLQDQRGAIFFDNNIYPVKDKSGAVESIAVYAKDVTEQVSTRAVEDIFSHLNAVLLKWPVNPEAIAQIFCKDILPVFNLAATWIGRAETDGRISLLANAAALAPAHLDHLHAYRLRWDGEPGDCPPAGRAIRSGQWQRVGAEDPECPSCHTITAADANSRWPILLFPLTLRGKTWGVLTLYGREARQFDGAQRPTQLAAIAARLGLTLESALQQEWLILLEAALENVANAVFITDAQAHILRANRAFEQLSGYAPAEFLGQTPKLFSSGSHDGDFYERFWQTIQGGKTWRGELVNAHRDGSRYTVNQTVTPLLDDKGQVSHYVALLEDISERKAEEERMRHTANFDVLTDLPNRGLFFDRLGQALALARRDGLYGALMFMDLDHFKEVNDQLGHAAGDTLLIEVARRLRAQVRESDTVARLGGDEFTVILPSLHDGNDAVRVANNILATIAQPFLIAGSQATVGISIGIALFPENGRDAQNILMAADHAMYQAKNAGRNRYVFATPQADDASRVAPGGDGA